VEKAGDRQGGNVAGQGVGGNGEKKGGDGGEELRVPRMRSGMYNVEKGK
jgi:hypothetical protein